jgi:STE24 endopeptidase
VNAYAFVIAAALVAEYLVNLVVDRLNLKTMGGPLPAEFADAYDPETYRKSQEYTRARSRFGVVSSTTTLALTFAFWFAGGFNAVDRMVRGWALPEVLTGLAFIGVLAFLRMIIALPFSAYSTFVIEQRFGFNRTTPGTFAGDLLKGLALGVVIGGGLVAGILLFFGWAGPEGWLWCWAFGTAVTLLLQFVAPAWLMPLFNKFTPLADGELKERILAYAAGIGFPIAGIFVMDGSKRSSKSNAFFSGFGKFKRIALFDTLIAKHTVPELVAVLAHEIGHYRKKHVLTGTAVGVAHMGAVLWLFSLFIGQRPLFDAFFMDEASVYAGLLFFGLLFTPVEFFLSLAMHALSRKHEFEADAFAAATIDGGGDDLATALKKLSSDNLSNLTPHPAYVFLHYSHPPVLERMRRLRDGTVRR